MSFPKDHISQHEHFPLYPSSNKMLQKGARFTKVIEPMEYKEIKCKYPFVPMQTGQSFAVNDSVDARILATMRTQAHRVGIELGRKYAVLHHKDLGLYEFGRIK